MGGNRVTFSPKLTSTMPPKLPPKLQMGFLTADKLRDSRNNSFSPAKKSSEHEETLSIQQVSASSVKSGHHCNAICPFCVQTVQHIDNSDKTYAYVINGSQKTYLAHSDCNPSTQYSPNLPKISVHSDIIFANTAEAAFHSAINTIDTIPDIKKAYFLKVEAFHPISSGKLFKFERICNELCTTIDENKFLYLNLDPQNSFFEQSLVFPFTEFRMVVTVYQTHSNEDAFTFEFNVDLSELKTSPNEESRESKLEISACQTGGSELIFGINTLTNVSKENFLRTLGNKAQYYHTSIKNTLLKLKYMAVGLPLKRSHVKPLIKASSQVEHTSHFAKESQMNYQSPSGKLSGRLRVFNNNQDHETRSQNNTDRIGSQGSIPNGSIPILPFNANIQPNSLNLHQQDPSSIYNTQTSLTAENSPSNRKASSPDVKAQKPFDFSPSKSEHHNSFSVATETNSNSHQENNNNNNNSGSKQQQQQQDNDESEFRLDDNLEKIVQLARTYRGSKVLQDFIIKANKGDLDKMISRMANNMIELMLDPYANYMIQILAKHCQPEQRLVLLQKIAPAMYRIACDKKGTYALQTIVSLISTHPEDILMKQALGNHVLELSLDIQGNHVIQKLINAVSVKNIEFIYQPLVDNFLEVATHSSGSLVFKQLIMKVDKIMQMKTTIIHLVCHEMENLVQDPYGNYVIQYALEYYPKDCLAIQQKIINKLIPYSSQKFSSNIIEKSLAVGDYFFRKKVAAEILKNDRLADLLKNKYGNYVILHTLAICDTEDKQNIMAGIHRCVYSFQGTKYKLRWIKFLDENPLNISWNPSSPSNKNRGNQVESFGDYSGQTPEQLPPGIIINREDDLQKLEIVKKIWRDMNKEEKKEGTPHNGRNHHHHSKSYQGFDDYSDSPHGSPNHNYENNGNYYQQQENFNLYVSPTKMEDNRKWY